MASLINMQTVLSLRTDFTRALTGCDLERSANILVLIVKLSLKPHRMWLAVVMCFHLVSICQESPATFDYTTVWHGFLRLLLPSRHLFTWTFDTTMMDSKQECLLMSISFSLRLDNDDDWHSQENDARHGLRFIAWVCSSLFMTEFVFRPEIIFDFLMVRHILWNPRPISLPSESHKKKYQSFMRLRSRS